MFKVEKQLGELEGLSQEITSLKASSNRLASYCAKLQKIVAGGNNNVGNGNLEQTFMDYRNSKQCKDKLNELDEENTWHDFLVSTLLECHAVQKGQMAYLSEQLAEMGAEIQILRAERAQIRNKRLRSSTQ